MKFIEVSENQRSEYNQFVSNARTGSFLQSYEWGEWQKNLGREAFRFFLTDNFNNNNTVGTIQLIKMPLPLGRFYLYAPYGPVIMKHETCNMEHLIQEIKQKFSEAVFMRIEPKEKLSAVSSQLSASKVLNIQPGKTLLIDLSKTEQVLLAEMHSKTRYNINLAKKHGVRAEQEIVVTPGHGLYFTEVVKLIADTETRQKYKGHEREYYEKFIDFFSFYENSDIKVSVYKALYNRELVSAGIFLDFGNTRTYLFGGSSENFKNIMSPYLLHWTAMIDAKKQNLKFYDFWGTETAAGKVSGFVRFKLGFGGNELIYGGAYDLAINRNVYALYKILRKLKKML